MPTITLIRHERTRWVLGQILLVTTLIVVYFGIRGLTESTPQVAAAHAESLTRLEQRLGIFWEIDLQRLMIRSDSVETVANWIYLWGHWPVILTVLAWLLWRHREVYGRLRDAMTVSGLLGMLIFVAYPVAPPRLAEPLLVDTVTQQTELYHVLQPPQFVNQYAAMPSLHAGWDLVVGIAIFQASTHLWLRIIGCVLPVLMAVSVVVTANHYLLDVVVGLSLGFIGQVVAGLMQARRRRLAEEVPRHRRSLPPVVAELGGVPLPRVDGHLRPVRPLRPLHKRRAEHSG